MGTDIYLRCDGEDFNYLRAAIWNVSANILFRKIFPDKYWDGDSLSVIPYDFLSEENNSILEKEIKKYENTQLELLDDLVKLKIESLREFWNKGKTLQKEGKTPTVYISW